MDEHDRTRSTHLAAANHRHQPPPGMGHLLLRELDRADVFDRPEAQLLHLQSFGAVRETCPHCTGQHLRLILRQECVRIAHLFCERCHACFDARYENGRCALTI